MTDTDTQLVITRDTMLTDELMSDNDFFVAVEAFICENETVDSYGAKLNQWLADGRDYDHVDGKGTPLWDVMNDWRDHYNELVSEWAIEHPGYNHIIPLQKITVTLMVWERKKERIKELEHRLAAIRNKIKIARECADAEGAVTSADFNDWLDAFLEAGGLHA